MRYSLQHAFRKNKGIWRRAVFAFIALVLSAVLLVYVSFGVLPADAHFTDLSVHLMYAYFGVLILLTVVLWLRYCAGFTVNCAECGTGIPSNGEWYCGNCNYKNTDHDWLGACVVCRKRPLGIRCPSCRGHALLEESPPNEERVAYFTRGTATPRRPTTEIVEARRSTQLASTEDDRPTVDDFRHAAAQELGLEVKEVISGQFIWAAFAVNGDTGEVGIAWRMRPERNCEMRVVGQGNGGEMFSTQGYNGKFKEIWPPGRHTCQLTVYATINEGYYYLHKVDEISYRLEVPKPPPPEAERPKRKRREKPVDESVRIEQEITAIVQAQLAREGTIEAQMKIAEVKLRALDLKGDALKNALGRVRMAIKARS